MSNIHALLQRWFKKYRASNSGGVLIYIAFGLPILLGAMALSIDLGRVFILNTELKDFSDAAALAGAAELDGRPGAMVAAEAAARTGISGSLINVQAFATDGDGPNIQVDQVVFLKNLPADGTDFTAADTATTDAEAQFIFVSVVDRSVTSGLSRALGVIPDFETTAKSIAGFSSLTCRIPPIFMCNPLEDPDFPVPDPSEIGGYVCQLGPGVGIAGDQGKCIRGRQMLAKKGGQGGGTYEPGNFGLLQPTNCDTKGADKGAKCIAQMIAAFTPDFCVGDTVDTNPGANMGPVRAAFNVRFDLYENPFFKKDNDTVDANGVPLYPPALNVGKARTATGCPASNVYDGPPHADPNNPPPPYIGHGFPRDTCFATNTCAKGRFGDGDWQQTNYDHDGDGGAATPEVEPYWAVNHTNSATSPPSGYADMTRYDVYRHEIENNMIPDPTATDPSSGEDANPSCFMDGTISPGQIPDPTYDADDVGIDETDRRLIIMAAVNCVQYEIDTGTGITGNETDVPVEGLVKIFMTESICSPSDKTAAGEKCEPSGGTGSAQADVYVELNDSLNPGDAEVFRDVVQLYR